MGRYANFQGCARKSYDVRVGNIITFATWCYDYGSPHRIWQASDTGRMRNEVFAPDPTWGVLFGASKCPKEHLVTMDAT